jgi:hypothetical protein
MEIMESYPTYRAIQSHEAPPWLPWKFFRARVNLSTIAEKAKRSESRTQSEVSQLVIKQLLRPVLVKPTEEQALFQTETSQEDRKSLTEYLAHHALTALPPGEVIHRISLPAVVAPVQTRPVQITHRRAESSLVEEPEDIFADLLTEKSLKRREVVSSFGRRRPKTQTFVPLQMEICGNRMGTPMTHLRKLTQSSLSPVRRYGKSHITPNNPVKIPQAKQHQKLVSLDATTQSIRLHHLPAESSSDSLSSMGQMPPITLV